MDTKSSPTVLVPACSPSGCLAAYLQQQSDKLKRRLPADLAASETTRFETDVRSVGTMLERWESSDLPEQFCALMLGKVQSGKTKHLLSTMAWAVDHGVDVTAIFTGVTDSLLNQTRDRLQRDFGALGRPYIKIIKVPTVSARTAFDDAKRELLECIQTRRKNPNPNAVVPMPILVTLKNTARIDALIALLQAVREEMPDARTLLIDDEADQASPNALARSRKIAKIYEAIARTRGFAGRHALLSYTATPQAILLTDKAGALRPNRCKLVTPGHGYFGLARVFERASHAELAKADDWDDALLDAERTAPPSLRRAIAHFAVALWVRQVVPAAFYALRPEGVDWQGRPSSVQMLVHQSAIRTDHRSLAKLVRDEKASICQSLMDPSSAAAQKTVQKGLLPALTGMRSRLPEPLRASFPAEFEAADLSRMYELLNGQTRLEVVNADGSPQAGGNGFPSSDEEWEPHLGWILVGGNILGRGLTIPQLVSTYFVRAPNRMTFDTVAQQLRFCGYRREYEHMLHLAVPDSTRHALEYMRDIDQVTWAKATSWDHDDTDLISRPPRIYYASPPDINLDPSRRSVMDPEIRDHKLEHQLFVGKRVFSPARASENARLIRNWAFEHDIVDWKSPAPDKDGWLHSADVSPTDLRKLLVSWGAHSDERQQLLDVADVFELAMEMLGLGRRPIRAVIRGHQIIDALANNALMGEILSGDQNIIRRKAAKRPGVSASESLDEWLAAAREEKNPTHFASLEMASPYIGEGQRKVQRADSAAATYLLIEPLLAVEDGRAARDYPHAVGLALGLLAPADYSVRILGHGDVT